MKWRDTPETEKFHFYEAGHTFPTGWPGNGCNCLNENFVWIKRVQEGYALLMFLAANQVRYQYKYSLISMLRMCTGKIRVISWLEFFFSL